MSNMDHEVQVCLKKIKSGDIHSSVKDVESLLMNENHENVAINILLQTSSSITSANLQKSTSVLDIFKISQACCAYLKSGFKYDEVKYLSALHHILKYIIEKGNLVDASNLANYLCIVKQHDAVAKILYATYYSFRTRLMEELPCALDVQLQIKVLKETANILMCCGSKYLSIVVDHAAISLKLIEPKDYNNNFSNVLDCTLHILELYLTSKHVASVINTKTAIKCTNILLQLALKCVELDSYELVSNIVNLLVSTELNLGSESAEAHCFKLFRLTLSSFVCEKEISQGMLENLRKYLAIVVSKYGAHDMVENVCVCFTLILSTIHKKWLNWTAAEWTCQWSLRNINYLHKIIIAIIQLLENFRSRKCNITEEEISSYLKNIVYTTLLNLIVLSTSRYYLSVCNELPEQLVLCAHDAFKKCIASISELKQREFSTWASYWTNVVNEVFKILQELTNKEQWLLKKKFYADLCKTFAAWGDTGQESCSVKNGTLSAFIGYIKASLFLKEYENALRLCAVALVFLSGDKKKIFDCWGYTKQTGISEGCLELEQYSLLNLFEEENNKYFSEFPSIKWDRAVIEEYFIAELEYYSKHRTGLFNCLYAVSKDILTRVSNPILEARVADILLDAACSQEDLKILQHCSSVGKERLSRLMQIKHVSTKVEKFKLLVILGNLHYRIFFIDFLQLQIVQKERLDYVESGAPKFEPKDEKELFENTYNVTSEYENLTIEKEAKFVQQLNSAVHYWLQLLNLEEYADMEYLKNAITNAENVAYMYGLLGCVSYEINVWGLYYKLNVMIGNDTGKLQAISSILRLGNFESEPLLEEFDAIAQRLEIDDICKVQQIYFYCNYLLGKSSLYFKNLQLEIGVTFLIEVKNLVAKSPEYEHKLILAECYYLLSKYLSTNGWKIPPELQNDLSLSCAFSALWTVKYLVGQKRRNFALRTRLLNFTLQLIEWLTEMHVALGWNTEIFCILKEWLVTCQAAVLPIRSSKILAFMAEISLVEKDLNTCKSKMMTLEKILNLKSYRMADDALNELKNYVQKLKVSSTDKVDSIFQKHGKLANFNLDNDVRNELICSSRDAKCNEWLVEASSGSPDFRMKVPRVYRALSHQDDCSCYMCQNFVSHTVVIHYYYIVALYTELVKCFENIIPTYEAGLLSTLCLYEREAKQIATLNETFTEVTGLNITFCEIQDRYKIYCTKYMALFSDFLASHKVFKEASELNAEAICVQETVKGPKTFHLRDNYVVKYGLAIFQMCNSETVGNSYEETLRMLLEENAVAKFKALGDRLKTPLQNLKCVKKMCTPIKDNTLFTGCKKISSFKWIEKNEDQFSKRIKPLIFDSSSDSEDDFLHKATPQIIITDYDNVNTESNAGNNTNNSNVHTKNTRQKKNNFSVYVSPGEDIKQSTKKEKSKPIHHLPTSTKIKDQDNDKIDNFCVKEIVKNKSRPKLQRECKNACNTGARKKNIKHKYLVYESSEEEIEQSTESCHDFLPTINETAKSLLKLKLFSSSSDEETFSTKSKNPTKVEKYGRNKAAKEVSITKVKNEDESDPQKYTVKQKGAASNITAVKENRANTVSTSKTSVALKSKTRKPKTETNVSLKSGVTKQETSECDDLVKLARSVHKELPPRRVNRKKV